MLKHRLIHPQILEVLGRAGHHAKILIADGGYPASSKLGPRAQVISLNLMPGLVTCTQALTALASAIPIEAAHTMDYERTGQYALKSDPPVWAEYRQAMKDAGLQIPLEPIEKWKFYEAVATPDHVLTIQTGDLQRYANLLLTVGVRME
jgi:L-fucose mutarotase